MFWNKPIVRVAAVFLFAFVLSALIDVVLLDVGIDSVTSHEVWSWIRFSAITTVCSTIVWKATKHQRLKQKPNVG